MEDLTSRRFWIATAERAVKTVAQVAVAFIGTGFVGVLEVNWLQLMSVSAVVGLVSVLTSISSIDSGQVKQIKAQ